MKELDDLSVRQWGNRGIDFLIKDKGESYLEDTQL